MRVVVVGGGLAGLFTASELVATGVDEVIVVEEASRPGGVARTVARDGFSLEPAAGSFTLPHPHLSPILERAGVEVIPAKQADIRHVFVDDRLVVLRPSPGALLAPVLSLPAKLRALAEPLVRQRSEATEESLAGFCERRFGIEAGRLLSSLMASGVFGGDPAELSANAAFPTLTELEEEAGSVLRGAIRRRRARPEDVPRPRVHVPADGMAGMAKTLANSLGGRFRGDFKVQSVSRRGDEWVIEGPERLVADAVVLTVHPLVAARLIGGEAGDALRSLESAPVAVVGMGGAGPMRLPGGFGALIGPDEGLVSVGVLFESSYAPSRAPEGSWLVKVIAGGARRPDITDWDDDILVRRVAEELERLVGKVPTPDFVEVVRQRPGIPQYTIGHRRRLTALEGHLDDLPGLHLAGWGYRGVGLASLARDGARLAMEIGKSGPGS
ncbi:MAG: protoporphyrinogen oxidase [Actinomycetota bacterium]